MQHTGPLIRPVFNNTPDMCGLHDAEALGLDAVRKFTRRSWRTVLVWLTIFVSIGIAFTSLAPSYYTATNTMLIDERMMRPANENGAAIPDPAFVDSQIQVLQSSEVFDRVLARARNGDFGDLGGSSLRLHLLRLATSWGLVQIDLQASAGQAVVSALKRGLIVRRIGTSNAVEIAFTAHDPEVVAEVANAFAHEYLASEMEMKQAGRREVLQFFRERLQELQARAFSADPSDPTTPAREQDSREARAKWREIQTTTDVYRALYNNTLQRRYAQSLEQISPSARVITPAEPPENRSWPRTPLVVGFAIAFGLVFGFGHSIWRFATDNVVRSRDDLLRASGMRPNACIPRTPARKWSKAKECPQGVRPAYLTSAPPVYSAMNRLAIRIVASAQARRPVIVAVVSPHSGAGTSTLAGSLARALSTTGRTLLFDANWRSARRDGQAETIDALDTAAARLEEGQLSPDVLSLRATGEISEADAAQSLLQRLHAAAERYAWVVLDLNPLNCSADIEAVAASVSFVVLIVSAGETTIDSLEHAADVIPRDTRVCVVLNKASRADAPPCR